MLKQKLTEDDILKKIGEMIDVCEKHIEIGQDFRQKAINYYNYNLTDLQPEQGRSTSVSNELRSVIKDILPSIVRSFLKSANLVRYEPNTIQDEEIAEQASLYVNKILIPQTNFEQAIYDAIFDAVLLKTGILKWQAIEDFKIEYYEYQNQSLDAINALSFDDDAKIEDLTQNNDQTFNFTVKRTIKKTDIQIKAIPRGSFLIFPNIDEINDSPIVGDMEIVTRSDLVARGYDKDTVYELQEADNQFEKEDSEAYERKKDYNFSLSESVTEENEDVLIFNLFLKLDLDEDGIAEIYSVCVGRGGQNETEYQILSFEQHYEYPYASIVVEREAHQFEGRSIAEDVMSLQKVNTSLMRQALDNVYWANNPQKVLNAGAFLSENLEKAMNPDFGQPLIVKNSDQMESVRFIQTPFIAPQAFEAMEVMRQHIQNRTGVNESAGGLNPDNLSNVTQIAIEAINAPALAQSEMMMRNITVGLEKVFMGVLKLLVQYTDQPKIAKVNQEWVQFDPKLWDSDMRCTVSFGYGTGGRKEDMQLLTSILTYQKSLIEMFGMDNPFVKPEHIYNTLENLLLSAGLPTVGSYFAKPNQQEIEQKAQQAQQQPDPETLKLQQQKELEILKMQTQTQIEDKQQQADLSVQQAELEKKYALENQKMQFENQKLQFEMQKQQDEIMLKKYEIELRYQSMNRGFNEQIQ